MASLLADAQRNLTNWKNVYQSVRLNHEFLEASAQPLGREGEKDENGSVNPSAVLIVRDHARMNSSLDASMLAVLRTFSSELQTPNDEQRDPLLARLREYMSTHQQNKKVKSRGTVYDSPVAGGSNVGNAVLYVCSKDANDQTIESATIELLTFTALGASADKSGLGLESYSIRGEGKSTRSEFSAGGRGTVLSGHTAIGPGRSGLIGNASFDLPFRGTGVNKIPGWDIESGEANIARNTANIAEDRGSANHASLLITGNTKFRFYFRKQGIPLSYIAPIMGGVRWLANGANGNVSVRIGSSGNIDYEVSVATSNQSSFQNLTLDPDDLNAWRRNYDTDGNPFLEIEVSGYVSGNIYLDDAFCDYLDFIGGRYVRVVSGVVPVIRGDSFTQNCSLTVGSGGVLLDSGASGSVNSITVNGVEQLTQPIPFTSSLETTAELVAEDINSHRTFPNYVATAVAGNISLKQEVPVEGTFVVEADTTTIATTEIDVTGASLGEKQDAIVRRTGNYLPHGTVADSGWGDND
jgi:hypothetical protein